MADAAENSTDQTGPSMPVLVDAFRQLRLSSPGPEGKETKCLLYGLLPEMVGDMLTLGDCSRGDILRVAGLIYSLPIDDITEKSRCGFLKAFSIPTYQTIFEAMKHEPEARVIVNFACSQSVCHSSSAFMSLPSIKAIVVVASDLPERKAQHLSDHGREKHVAVVGPCFPNTIMPEFLKLSNERINTSALISPRLYYLGSVGYVCKMSNLCHCLDQISYQYANGVFEGIAPSRPEFKGWKFLDFFYRLASGAQCKILLLLTETGGTEEYELIEAVRNGIIQKPILALAVENERENDRGLMELEKASVKNEKMREAGFIVPYSMENLPMSLALVHLLQVMNGEVEPSPGWIAP